MKPSLQMFVGAILLCLGIMGIIWGIRTAVNDFFGFYIFIDPVDYGHLVYLFVKAFIQGYLFGTAIFAAFAVAGGTMLKRSFKRLNYA